MTGALEQRVAERLGAPVNPAVRGFAARLGHESGARAVLFYGSNLRTGELEGVLDFYVLLPGPERSRIWPQVSYREWEHGGTVLRAKIATMALSTFERAASGRSRDTTIWARFVQPSALVWSRDRDNAAQAAAAIVRASRTAARLAAALGPLSGTAEDFWRALFRATYRSEFRVEQAGREDAILVANRDHFAGLLPLAWSADGIPHDQGGSRLSPRLPGSERKRIARWWRRRRRLGKPLNLLRLAKASATFEGAARYAAWKVERHTGVPVDLSPWRERHPILAAPGVLYRVWQARRRAD